MISLAPTKKQTKRNTLKMTPKKTSKKNDSLKFNKKKKNFSPLYIAQRGDGTAIHVSNLFKKDKFGGKIHINLI